MEKKEIKNKQETPKTEKKAPKKEKKVDFSKLGDKVEIISTGQSKHMKKGEEYTVTKEVAIILINKGDAKLK